MSDTPRTPRTDSAEWQVGLWNGDGETIFNVVDSDVARDIEHELAAATKERDELRTALEGMVAACDDPDKIHDPGALSKAVKRANKVLAQSPP